jgi:glutathione peroxidase
MTGALQNIGLKTISGEDATLADYAGKVLLIVNVASKCGLTPQYEALQWLYRDYRDRGFAVLGFPSNDFRGQEPGTEAEIAAFCQANYAVDFPMFAKIKVAGENKHPLYEMLVRARPHAVSSNGDAMRDRLAAHGIAPNPEPEILWNFEKFLVGRDGAVVARFAPDTAPDDPGLVREIESALA